MLVFLGIFLVVSQSFAQRLYWELNEGWNRQPWKQHNTTQKEIYLQTTITIPKDRPLPGSVLVFEGFWWKGVVTINKQEIHFTGGLYPTQVKVGKLLKHGQNNIKISIKGPKELSSRTTGGRLNSLHTDHSLPQLLRPPVLLLRPQIHLQNIWLTTSNNQVTAKAEVNAPDGSKVTYQAVLDGKVMASLGTATVNANKAFATPQDIPTTRWAFDKSNLFHLVATLSDKNGKVLDRMDVRTGIREVNIDGSVNINKTAIPILGVRITSLQKNITKAIREYKKAGVNAIEFHGEMIDRISLGILDELGIPVIIVPRCIGRTNYHKKNEIDDETLAQQDQRFVSAIRNHPSLILIALEGQYEGISLNSKHLTNSELPIVGNKNQTARMRFTEDFTPQCLPNKCTDKWLIEMTFRGSRTKDWKRITNGFMQQVKGGIIGAILPVPQRQDRTSAIDWQNHWKTISQQLNIPQLKGTPVRASTALTVTNLTTSSWPLIVSVPLLSDQAKSVSPRQATSFYLWHRGKVRVRYQDSSTVHSITGGQWINLFYNGPTNTLYFPKP